MADHEVAYLRRAPDPNPMLEALARQAVDRLERWIADGLMVNMQTVQKTAEEFGVPIAYILDEWERRVRARQEGR